MRACAVPFYGDPIVATFWWKFFINVWQDEVDKVYAYIGNDVVPIEILEYFSKLLNHPKVEYKVLRTKGHGEALKQIVLDCKEDYLFLTEEDAFVFKKGAINREFLKVESGAFDFLGSPRGSASKEIIDAEMNKFNLTDVGLSFDTGPNFWPNFVFTTKNLLMKTDMCFDSKDWEAGETVPIIDHLLKEHGSMDTFAWVSLQIRNLTKKIDYIPQYKAYPIDPFLKRNNQWTFNGNANWIHAGSMSSGLNRYLREDNKIRPEDVDHEDFIMRIAWWYIAANYSVPILKENGLSEFVDKYLKALTKLKLEVGISDKEVLERRELYENLLRY